MTGSSPQTRRFIHGFQNQLRSHGMDPDGAAPEGASTAADNFNSLALMFAAIRSARRHGITIRMEETLKEAQP